MSIQYQKEIYANDKLKLFVNFAGIDSNNTTTAEEIILTIYAFNVEEYIEIFSAALKYDQILELFNHLNAVSLIRENSQSVTSLFVEASPETHEIIALLKTIDATLVKAILDKANENEKLEIVLKALTDSEINNLYASIRQTAYQKAIKNLNLLLDLENEGNIVETIRSYEHLMDYAAGQPEKIFQNWIEKNTWALGVEYIKKHHARKIGLYSESDLIMETTDGFIDLIELKRPRFELFAFDKSHNSYYPSVDLAKVLGQCLLYLEKLDEYKAILERTHKFKLLRPRIKIIVGRSNKFDDEQYSALRMLNSNLNHIEVISYDYLLQCGQNIISHYSIKK